jgi:3-isopropylmalate/(R)-2-methylmalate dehydratase large subunit
MEFTGETISSLSMEGRFTMANMAVEAGGKNGIFHVDEKTLEFVKGRTKRNYTIYNSDPDAKYAKVYEWDVSKLEPQIAFPHLPENTKPLSACGKVTIDQSIIGSCTNGRIEDLREAAAILKGKKVNPNIRLIIIPGTQAIWRQAMREGLFDIFMDAGAAISTPTCGPCLGGHMGVLAKGERAIATTNRNFVGRMGHPESEVYLAGPAVAAASAIAGYIAGPEEVGVVN